MTKYCKDCSYRGKSSGQSSECPACGSYNFGQHITMTETLNKAGKLRLSLLVCLWGYLFGLIIWKLYF